MESVEPSGDLGDQYEIRLTRENDGHAALGATVIAVAVADEEGRYTALVSFPVPDAWTVRLASVIPTSTSVLVEEIAPSAPTETSTAPTSTSTSTSTRGLPAGGQPPEGSGGPARTSSGSDQLAGSMVLAVTLVVIVGGASAAFPSAVRKPRST